MLLNELHRSMYEPPVLCLVCDLPALDTGVRVSQLNHEKFCNWWEQKMDTELDDSAETLESSWVCQFCIYHARAQKRVGEVQVSSLDWWTDVAVNEFYQKYYGKEDLIQPCEVKVTQLEIPESESSCSENEADAKSKSIFAKPADCVYCGKEFLTKKVLQRHVAESHDGAEIFHCEPCSAFFKSASDKQDHALRVHLNAKSKCVYCTDIVRLDEMQDHVKFLHKSRAIKCDFSDCVKFFLSLAEKQKHVADKHTAPQENYILVCIKCPFLARKRYIMKHHFMEKHKLSNCNFICPHCQQKFQTYLKLHTHILVVHEYEEPEVVPIKLID